MQILNDRVFPNVKLLNLHFQEKLLKVDRIEAIDMVNLIGIPLSVRFYEAPQVLACLFLI